MLIWSENDYGKDLMLSRSGVFNWSGSVTTAATAITMLLLQNYSHSIVTLTPDQHEPLTQYELSMEIKPFLVVVEIRHSAIFSYIYSGQDRGRNPLSSYCCTMLSYQAQHSTLPLDDIQPDSERHHIVGVHHRHSVSADSNPIHSSSHTTHSSREPLKQQTLTYTTKPEFL